MDIFIILLKGGSGYGSTNHHTISRGICFIIIYIYIYIILLNILSPFIINPYPLTLNAIIDDEMGEGG